jgi:hypothetical protein
MAVMSTIKMLGPLKSKQYPPVKPTTPHLSLHATIKISPFKHLNSVFNQVFGTWIGNYPGKDIMILMFGKLFAEARRTAATFSAGNCFRACGVHPVNIPEAHKIR